MFLLYAALIVSSQTYTRHTENGVLAYIRPRDGRVRIEIPQGRCRVRINGKTVELSSLVPLARRWSRTGRPVRIIPDPKATSTCVDRVEAALTRGAGKRGFADEELPEPENSK